jgi:hypothetical protein
MMSVDNSTYLYRHLVDRAKVLFKYLKDAVEELYYQQWLCLSGGGGEQEGVRSIDADQIVLRRRYNRRHFLGNKRHSIRNGTSLNLLKPTYYLFVIVLVDFVPKKLTHGPGSDPSPMFLDHHLPNNINTHGMNA